MKMRKWSGVFSLGIVLSGSLFAGELQGENCSSLLTAALGEVNSNFKDLPEPIHFDYAPTIEHIREIRSDVMPNTLSELHIHELQKEKEKISETIKAIQDEEETLGELRAMEDISFGAHASRDLSSIGRLPMLRQERKRLEDLRTDIEIRLKNQMTTLSERPKEHENIELSKAVHKALTRNLDEAIKGDLSSLAHRLAEQEILPKGQHLNCSRHNWRIYEDQFPPNRTTEISLDQLIDRNPPPHTDRIVAMSLCHSRGDGDSDFVLMAFHGVWNPSTFALEIDRVSYQNLKSVFPAEVTAL